MQPMRRGNTGRREILSEMQISGRQTIYKAGAQVQPMRLANTERPERMPRMRISG